MKYARTTGLGIATYCLIGLVAFTSCAALSVTRSEIPSVPSLVSFRVEGKDDRGSYRGSVGLLSEDGESARVRAVRLIRYEDGTELRMSGVGTIAERSVQLRFKLLAAPSREKAMVQRIVPPGCPARASQVFLTGKLDKDLRSGTVVLRSRVGSRVRLGEERWTLETRRPQSRRAMWKVTAGGPEWVSVPVPVESPGVVKVTAPSGDWAQGFFLRRGERLPEKEVIENDCVGCPISPRRAAELGLSSSHPAVSGPTWVRHFRKKDLESEWVFWFRDPQRAAREEFELSVAYIDLEQLLPLFCDPWVSIDVSPSIVARGQPITITLNASASAGLDMYWWFGATGIAELDKAHIREGLGLPSGSSSWTITIDQPGTYRFGANSRDRLYWTDPGVPHQASEACGLAWDEIDVRDVRKSYKIGFILLAPQGTDISSAVFQAELEKLEDIKSQLEGQFERSTDGMGMVDISYPTVVLMPPGPVYGLSDGGLMWEFLADTLREEFYTSHPDIFDFLAIYEMYPDVSIGSRHLTVKTFVAGFGIYERDNTYTWGSAGKLRGIGLATDVTGLPSTYEFMASEMHLLLHEVFGHQWGVFAERLDKGGFHFDIGIESPTFTVLYGRPWRKVDDTHFTTADIVDPVTNTTMVTFHPWMLYVAGMKLRGEVPEVLMDVEPDNPPSHRYDLVTTTGTFTNVTLQSIIDAEGDRYDVEW